MRDFKKFNSKKIIETLQSESESRKERMLEYFKNLLSTYPESKILKSGKMAIMLKKFFQINGLKKKSTTSVKSCKTKNSGRA